MGVLADGDVVLITEGPRTIDGRVYWQIYRSARPNLPLGWVPAERNGLPTLTPFLPDCPPTLPRTMQDLLRLQLSSEFSGFACFGSRELVFSGRVHCYEAHGDGVIGGPFLDAHRSCTLDGVYIHGEPVFELLPDESGAPHDEIEGTYEVRGQFDHPASRRCSWIAFGTDIGSPGTVPDPGAVAPCRLAFVVNAVREL